MQLKTLQIVWHGKEPVLSVDFQPNSHTLVSGGQDGEVKHWEVVSEEDGSPGVRFLNSYAVNSKSVNCVRFSPIGDMFASAGDKGEVLLWRFTAYAPGTQPQQRLGSIDNNGLGGGGEGSLGSAVLGVAAGMWRQVGMLRGHCDDVLDLAWAPDGSALLSGGIENNCILWDVEGRKSLKWLQDHGHYVQGVAWDPLGRYIASQSADRTARVYAAKPPAVGAEGGVGKRATAAAAALLTAAALAREGFYPTATLAKGPLPAAAPASCMAPPAPAATQQQQHQLGGEGQQGPNAAAPVAATAAGGNAGGGTSKQPLFSDDSLPTFFRRLAWSPDGSFLAAPAGVFKATGSAPTTSTTHIFSRGDWSGPAISLPCLSKGALVVRFCPRLFRALQPAAGSANTWLPYRVLMAVASVDSVLVYDMQALEPLAVLGGIHFAAVTDMAWSDDGRYLVVASRDGYCTVCSFDNGELGQPVPLEELPPGVAAVMSRAAARRFHDDRTAAAAAKSSTAAAAAAAAVAAASAAAMVVEDPVQAGQPPVAPAVALAGAAVAAAPSGPRRIQPVAVAPGGGGCALKRPAEAANPGAAPADAPKPKRIQPIPLSAMALSAPIPTVAGGIGRGSGSLGGGGSAVTGMAAAAPPRPPPGVASPSRRRIVPMRVEGQPVPGVGADAGSGKSPSQMPPAAEGPTSLARGALASTPLSGGSGDVGTGVVVVPGTAGASEAPGSAAKMPTPQVLVFGTPPSATPAARGGPGALHQPQPHQGQQQQQRQGAGAPQAQAAVQSGQGPKRLTPIPVERGQRPLGPADRATTAVQLGQRVATLPPSGSAVAAGPVAPQLQEQRPVAAPAGLAPQPSPGVGTGASAGESVQAGAGGQQQQGQQAAIPQGGSGEGVAKATPPAATGGARLSFAQLAAMRGMEAARRAAGK